LKEITVDIKTVEKPKRPKLVDASAADLPKPAADLRPGKSSYQGKIEASGQTFPFSLTTEIKEEGGAWLATESANLPRGEALDTAWVEKGSLTLTKRIVKQTPVTIDVEFKDNKASGKMDVGGQAKTISVSTGGAIFADGAGAYNVLAALPLAEGYTATFRNF